ncbi:hypothetical protein DERP_006346 [Dermatophagoides pteronyssinus]|uniref:ABC transporter domain-containing protein n=1 Tax=Dermatophagoides pteronyssinus TaxID=6956 RepID=A0ABQ8IY65_DERPT|nr:hypothetical protein DERP_006346 [Dermatophagoides pteronyssinus]
MAFFKQLRLLLRHKILLRRRQPTILILELFWPAFVFFTILIARWQFPPTFIQTCYYNAKALPSAGLVNLLQSHICSMDNPCLNREQYEEVPNYPNATIHLIVDQILPLLTDKNVTNVINDLPKGIRLIAAIIDTLSIPSVQRLLENGFPLRSMLRSSGWKHVQQQLNRLELSLVPFYPDLDLVIEHSSSSASLSLPSLSWDDHNQTIQKDSKGRTYDILVNAHLNLMRFGIHSDSGNHQSFRSFRDVICDHNELEKFLIIPNRPNSADDIRFLSRHLCLLEQKDLYYLFDLVQDNIDFVNILQQLSLVFRSVGLDEHQQHLNNIRSMITTIDQANIFPSMTALRNTSWLYDLPSLFDVLRSGEIDVQTLLKIVNDIEPIFGDGVGDKSSVDENEQLENQRQNQRIEYLMRLYDSDDSSLKTIAHTAIGSLSSSTDETIDLNDDDYSFDNEDETISLTNDSKFPVEHKEMTILHNIDDLDTSETANVNLLSIAATNYPTDSLGRRFLPKLLANMDKFIDGAEKFTRTPQWNSLLNAFQGLQMMLEMTASNGQQQFSSTNIEQFIINFPKNIQALTNFFNSIVPEKFQPLVLPLFNLVQRIADSMLQHLSGAFTRALNEDKIYYFDKLVQLLIASMNNGTLPRKCFDMQHAMCDFDQFQSVFIKNIDDETGEIIVMVDEDIGTLQGIQELGCIFFGQNYLKQNVEESTPILAKLYYTLSALNDTNQLSSSLAALGNSTMENKSTSTTNTDDDTVFWNNFTTRMLEVYLLATKSVNANAWSSMMQQMSYVWKRNRLFDRIILSSRVLQLTANCFTPERIMNSPIWFHIQRKNIIINEILNLVIDEINQAVENEALNVQQLSMGSPTLHYFLHKNLHLLPVLMDSIFDTLFFNLPRFVERIFQLSNAFMSNWPCNHFSIVDLLAIQNEKYRSEIYSVENFLCHQYHMNEGDYGRIIDELISPNNNQSRGAPLIRVLQNKSNNLSMIYEHVPPLDWVEAAHSVSMIKESAEKLIFADNNWIWFPEVDRLDSSIRQSFGRARLIFQQFYNQGMAGLFTYVGDIFTPFAIRYMSLNETFSQICDYGVSGILMAPVVNDKEWRCFFVSSKFASYSLQQLLELLNQVLTNFLHNNNQCRIFDIDDNGGGGGNYSNKSYNQILFLSDHIAEIIELIMNQLLLGDMNQITNAKSLQDIICNSNINLDIFNTNHSLYLDIRQTLCGLPEQFTNCFQLTMPKKWIETSNHLNFTWYTQSLAELSNKSSFVDAYRSVYRFLTLFGQFSPRFMNQLLSRFESTNINHNHGQHFIQKVLKRMNQMQQFRGKRFTYVMQSISLELYRIWFTNGKISQLPIYHEEKRDLMMALIYALNELPVRLRQRYKLGGIHFRSTVSNNNNKNNTNDYDDDIHLQIDLLDSLLDWLDSHLLTITDTILQTIILDRQRLNRLFHNKFDTVSIWRSFCRAPISQYFIVDNEISSLSHKAKDEICSMDFNSVYNQWFRHSKHYLSNYSNSELIGLLLKETGSTIDLILNDPVYKRDFLKTEDWQIIITKLNRLIDHSDNFGMKILSMIEGFFKEILSHSTIESIHRIIVHLKCGLNTIPLQGLNWDIVPKIYANQTDIMALYSTFNSAFTLSSLGLNTFLSQTKFYNHIQMSMKYGNYRRGFCHIENEQEFQEVFAIVPQSSANEIIFALRNLQTLLCDRKSSGQFWRNINPISKCLWSPIKVESFSNDLQSLMEHFQKSIKFHKSINHNNNDHEMIPPILDQKQWNRFFKWWQEEISPYPNSGRTLTLMRAFQLIDSFADEHVIWKAFYRLTYFTSEMFAYSFRALQSTYTIYPIQPDMKWITNHKSIKISSHQSPKKTLSSLLTSTVSNLIFPEVNHFITFATFRQLRWIRHISHYFAQHPGILHDELCPTLNNFSNHRDNSPIIVDEDFNDLLLLLCHNHPSDWIYSLTFKSNLFNIKASPRPKFISHRKIRERIGKLTQVLARMFDYNSDKNNQKLDHVIRFLKLKQLESIENVAGTGDILIQTILAKTQQNNRTITAISFKELLWTSWRSVPSLLDTVDQYICSYKQMNQSTNNETLSSIVVDDDTMMDREFEYHPKAPDMKIVMCEMPGWNFDQAYTYLSKHLDLKNMLAVFASSSSSHDVVDDSQQSTTSTKYHQQCVTPLRFLSRWIDVGQDIFQQMYSSKFWSELKSCRKRRLISLLASTKSSNTFLLGHSLRYVRFMNKLLTTIDKFSHENKGVSWNNVRQLWQTFSFFILNQVPAYVPITDIVRNDVNLSEYLNATLDRISTLSRSRAKQAIRLLTDSMLDVNAISWNNFSNIALKEMICKQKESVKFLDSKNNYLPIIVKTINQTQLNLDINEQESLYDTLCHNSDQLMPIIDSLMAVIDHDSVTNRLTRLQRTELARSNWINDVLIPELTEMWTSGVLIDIGNKMGIIHQQQTDPFKSGESSSQKGINHLLISFVSMTRAQNFNKLYDTIKQTVEKLSPKFHKGAIVDSLNRILDGIQSLQQLAEHGLFQIKYQIHDLLVNADNVKIFLEKNLAIDRHLVEQIMNASIDLSEFIQMSARVRFDSSAFCNQTLLFDELKLQLPLANDDDMMMKYQQQQFTINNFVTEDFKFNNQILNQLVIRRLTYNIVNLIQNSLLKKAKIESSQIPKALNAIKASSEAMPYIKSYIKHMTTSFDHLDESIIRTNLHNISLSMASDLIGKIICGGSNPSLNREIKLLKVKVEQPKILSTNERNVFNSDFCLDGYRQIMQIQGGPVIWNFLKPILVGKILYTPKAPFTDMIMGQMNSTLKFMPRMVEMLHAWAQTLSSLESFYHQSDVNNRMNHVKHLIQSVFINGEADGLFTDFDTFSLIEKLTKSGNILAIVKLIGQVANCASFDRFVGVNDEIELEEMARNLTRSHQFIAGIVFVGKQQDYLDKNTLPNNIEYKIRIDIDFVPSTKALKSRIWEPGPRDHYLDDMQYMHGFVQIQEMIDRSIMALLTNQTNQQQRLPIDPEVHLQQQPYLCYGSDKYGNYIRSLAPLITTMAWIFLIAYLIREHVLERELHLEEVMRVMGLKSGVAWLTWFILGISIMTFATICAILLLFVGQLIPASDPILLFLFFMVFNVSLLMFCYMISSFFRTATIAALSGIVAYLASFLPFMVAITLENEMSFMQKIFTCLSMSTSFCFGMMYMTRFEVQGVGMQWNNLWHSPMQGDTMNVGTAIIMMAIDSLIYFIIAWYISHVHPPGNNARRYPALFFLSFSYWKNDFLRSFGFGEDHTPPTSTLRNTGHMNHKDLLPYSMNNDCHDERIKNDEDNTSITLENDDAFNIVDPDEWKSLSSKAFFNFNHDDNQMIADGTLKTISGTLKKAIHHHHNNHHIDCTTLTRKASQQSNQSTSSSIISQNPLGMEINGLYVIYNEHSNRTKHIAVSNLNLNLKEGQITTILGRNGAGKTTTINVLTGQMPPTSGTVTIYGYRIPDDFSHARRLLGYCPQYNTLFDDLTVREHLLFFAELKGLLQDSKTIENDVNEILHNMGLWNLQHQMAKHLSGGLKRRLCVALAFVGGSKLIILDEPTASVDPVARRRIWDLIVQQKRSRTILLTTHHMDEADILSDEVAVIYRGKLLCIGSPLLLKSKYGCGYRLTVSRQGDLLDCDSFTNLQQIEHGDEEESNVNSFDSRITIRPRSEVEKLMAFTKCLIPNASFVEDNNGQVILSLPQLDDHGIAHDYSTFFRCLDSNIRTLGFGSYGVTSTTLEEVFLTLCSLEELNMPVDEAKLAVARRLSHQANSYCQNTDTMMNQCSTNNPVQSDIQMDSGIRLKSRQLYALFKKRFLHMIRDWKLLFCTLFLPCLFIAFAMAMTLIKPSFAPDPALPLVPHIYGHSTVSFLHNHPRHGNFTEKFQMLEQELLESNDNQTVDCLQPRDKWRTAKCPIMKNKFESPLPVHLITLKGAAWDRNSRSSCKCPDCFHDIHTMSHFIPIPRQNAYGWFYNLSKLIDINQFLLRTQPEFMDRRWGGWSFRSIRSQQQRTTMPKRRIVKVWYDNNGFHTMPSYLNTINNALLRANLKAIGQTNSSYRITTYSHPLHVRSNQLGDQSVMQQAGDAGIAIIILVGFIFIPTSFVFYIVRERICEEKHLQKTFGVGPLLYWLSSLFWDLTILIIAIGFASAIIGFFRLPIYMSRLNLPAILTLLFFFGWAMINLVYLMEKCFDEPSIAFMGIYCLSLFIGIHTMVMRLMIDVFKLIEITPTIYQWFEKIAIFLPPYLLLSGIVDVHRNQLFADIFTLFDQDTYVNPFSYELLGRHFTIFAIQGLLFFIINLAIECDLICKISAIFKFNHRRSFGPSRIGNQLDDQNEDSDVADERRRVHMAFGLPVPVQNSSCNSPESSRKVSSDCQSTTSSLSSHSVTSPSSDILRVFNVTKLFENMFGYRSAVNNITFSVPRGECFGLLGVNGAGKTTLFRIITGQVKATTGETMFNGRNIREALANNYHNESIGYCPQADALDGFLTPIEHLTIYAHLRGIPRHQVSKFVKESIDKFQLQMHSTMPVQALSRGNRRKLCLAIAMLGRPQLILLDEPTSGLDPQSRRHVCQNIQDAIRDRRSILLTSHSMEECDILCSRLAIMVNGRFKCIGSPQYLKHKFGTGYIITLRLSEIKGNFNEAIEFIRENFPQSVLRAHHHTMLEFNLPTNEILLSNIFQVLQNAQTLLSLQDYSVSQTTLDQVFVTFANQQVNDFDGQQDGSNNDKTMINSKNSEQDSKRSSFLTAHDAKHQIKRHASMLVSLCRESPCTRSTNVNHNNNCSNKTIKSSIQWQSKHRHASLCNDRRNSPLTAKILHRRQSIERQQRLKSKSPPSKIMDIVDCNASLSIKNNLLMNGKSKLNGNMLVHRHSFRDSMPSVIWRDHHHHHPRFNQNPHRQAPISSIHNGSSHIYPNLVYETPISPPCRYCTISTTNHYQPHPHPHSHHNHHHRQQQGVKSAKSRHRQMKP